MKILDSTILYENPLPQLCSRQSVFPFLCECMDGSILAVHTIGEAFESVDGISYVSRSVDGGRSWSEPSPMFDLCKYDCPVSHYCKPVALQDGRVVVMGYAYPRKDPSLPLGNPKTGGLLDDFMFYAVSEDGGKTWGEMIPVSCSWGPHAEASAPLTILQDGTWLTPITGFPDWGGNMTGPMCGRALRSEDQGQTWSDEAICMDFGERAVTCYEQRMCQLESGAIICIGWNEDVRTGERLENHYTVSYDNGKTFCAPVSTGILGQAASVCAIGGERLLALHAVRRDTDRPGIYGYVVDFSGKTWNIVEEALLWEPVTPVFKDEKMAEIFSFLKFGQPGAILLQDGNLLMSHWYAQEGQYRTMVTRIALD